MTGGESRIRPNREQQHKEEKEKEKEEKTDTHTYIHTKGSEGKDEEQKT